MQTHAQFYALLSRMPGATKFGIVSQYDTTGSLSNLLKTAPRTYARMIADMGRVINGNFTSDGDKWRKMVIRSIGKYFELTNRYQNLSPRDRLPYITSTATRIAGCDDFNAIPIAQLQKIYNTFKHKQP